MGVSAAADKWKWVAIHIMDHTIPKSHALLDKLSQAVDPIAIRSLIKETEATIFVIKCTSFLFVILALITMIFLSTSIKHIKQRTHMNYVRFRYGDSVETIARTHANLMKFHSKCVQRSGIGIGAERTNVFLIGAGETAEAYLRHDHQFLNDMVLRSLLPQDQSFAFRTIKDALHTLDVCCTSEKKLPKTLFIFLLISTSWDCHEHEPFEMPSSLGNHCYAFVGIGLGDDGAPGHRLSKTSKGPNGEPLSKSHLGSGVCF